MDQKGSSKPREMTFPDSETDLEAESLADIEKTLPEPPPWKEEDHSHKQQGYNRETCWWW